MQTAIGKKIFDEITQMERVMIPNLKSVLIQTKYLETFIACGDTLRNLFPRERIAGINTTATKVMQKMTELDRNKVHPDILRLCDLLMDATCSMEKEYLSHKNDSVDVKAVNTQRRQLMKPKQIYGPALAHDFTKRIENVKHLVEDHKKLRANIDTERKVYQNLQSNISTQREALYKNNSSTSDNRESQQGSKCFSMAMLKHHGTTAESVFEKVQRLIRKENEIYKTMKEVENGVVNKMKSRLYDRLIDGLSDMQVIGLDPSVSKKSSERILKKVAELDKNLYQIIYRIISTGCQRYTCASLLPEIDNGATKDTSEDAIDIPNDTCCNTEYSDDTVCSTADNATECANQIKDDNTAIGANFDFKFADEDSLADDLSIGTNGDQSEGRLETGDITLILDSSPVSCQPPDLQLTMNLDSSPVSCQPSDLQLTMNLDSSTISCQPSDSQHTVKLDSNTISCQPSDSQHTVKLDSNTISCQPFDSQHTVKLDSNTISSQPSDSQLTTEARTITFINTYVQPKEVQHEASFLATMKGKKIKQKVCHIENIAFGWVRSKPWSLKKRWGFFCPEDVTCVQ